MAPWFVWYFLGAFVSPVIPMVISEKMYTRREKQAVTVALLAALALSAFTTWHYFPQLDTTIFVWIGAAWVFWWMLWFFGGLASIWNEN